MAQKSKTPAPAKILLKLVERSLDDDKAQDVVVIDLSGRSSVADYLVIASGTSQRHVATMADHIARHIKSSGGGSVPVEGQNTGDWVLIDAGDVIVHLFRPEVRQFYKLERLWTTPAITMPRQDHIAGSG